MGGRTMRHQKWGRAVCWALLGALIVTAPMLAAQLPSTNDQLAAAQYEGWAGVLRIWVAGGWSPGYGSFVPWLNACAAQFERRNPGVYVQVQSVDERVLKAFLSGEVNPPDAILFAPGMLDSGEGLLALNCGDLLREELKGAGDWRGQLRAVPVAMGGYIWAINRSMVHEVPDDWSTLETPEPLKKEARHLMQAPRDQAYISWSGALNALCAPKVVNKETGKVDAPRAGQGIDLGLPDEPQRTPAPTPTETRTILCKLPRLLPDDFLDNEQAFSAFASGTAAAIPATQREIRRLQLLSDNGRAPDWMAAAGNGAFTDQLLMMGVVDTARTDAGARAQLASDFVAWLLRDDSQQALASIRALRVTPGEALYPSQPGMTELERAYAGPFQTVSAFDHRFRQTQKNEAARLMRESASTEPHSN